MIPDGFVPDIEAVRQGYASGQFTPRALMEYLTARSARFDAHNIWIHQLSMAELEPYLQRLESADREKVPLYGVPFAIKDNIDLDGVPTSAACPEFAYRPDRSAYIVQLLIDAGAIPLGKTNMDQFATGLVGTRSPEPWGPCRNAFDPETISGGSSAGSAVAVALGLVSFSLRAPTLPARVVYRRC